MVSSVLKPFCCLAFLTFFIGCASSAPPSRVEQVLFTVHTNWVTNLFNVVQVNQSNNIVTNTFTITNVEPRYIFEPKQTALDTISTASSVATSSGVGWAGLAGTLIAGLLYAWAEFRNRDKSKLAASLAQSIETAREIFKKQPDGVKLDAAFKAEVKSQQVNAGVKAAAAKVVDAQVNNLTAKERAAKVMA